MLLAFVAVLWLGSCPASAAALGQPSFESERARVRAAFAADHLWSAVSLADALAARADLPAPARVWSLREAARLRAMVGDRATAARDLRQALSLAPDDVEALLALAAALRDDDLDGALEDARRAAELSSGARRGDAYRALAGLQTDAGDEKGARESLARAVRVNDGLDSLAALARAEDDPGRARALARRAEERARQAPSWRRGSALRFAGGLWLDLGELARAAGAYRAALSVDPDDEDALQGLLEIQAKDPQARPLEETAVDGSSPDEAGPPGLPVEELDERLEAARAALREGKKEDAISLADLFVDAVPDAPAWQQPDAYRAIAELFLELGAVEGAPERALGCAQRAYKLGLARVSTALLLMRARPELASDVAPGSVEFAAAAFAQAMQARRTLHDPAGARAALERGRRLLPESRQLRLLAAQAALDDGEPRRALELARPLEADGPTPTRVAALSLEERAWSRLGDAGAARRSLDRAASLAADDAKLFEDDSLLDRLLGVSKDGGDGGQARRLVERLSADLARTLRDEPGDWPTLKQAAALDLWYVAPSSAAALLEARHADVRAAFEVPWRVWHGAALAAGGRGAEARLDFDAAVAADPVGACFGPELPRRRERLPASFFDACLGRFAGDPRLYFDRALALFESGRGDAAVEDLRRAVALKPAWLEAQVSLVSALASLRRDREALTAADGALAAVAGQRGRAYDDLVALRRRLADSH